MPIPILSELKPFADFSFATVVPLRRAIAESVSPFLTAYFDPPLLLLDLDFGLFAATREEELEDFLTVGLLEEDEATFRVVLELFGLLDEEEATFFGVLTFLEPP